MKQSEALTAIDAELTRALQKHTTPMRSQHEGYAILLEEVEELWEKIKMPGVYPAAIREEAVQIGAMAARFLVDLL
jgi:hypothetical protein